MRIIRIFKHRLRSLFHRGRVDLELQREIDLHVQQLAKERISEGMTASEALLAARHEFGPVALTVERCRDTRRVRFLEDLARDAAFALRGLSKSPGFTLTALLSLALGIGANTAIYSFMDAILLRSLPVPEPQRLVIFNWRAHGSNKVAHSEHGDGYQDSAGNSVAGIFPFPFFESLSDRRDVFSSVFGFAGVGRLNLVTRHEAFLADGECVSGTYFSGIGMAPALGRLIEKQDDRAGRDPVAVISYRLWQARFGGEPKVIGQSVFINRKPFTIAGVAAPQFGGVNPRDTTDVFLPIHSMPDVDRRAQDANWFRDGNSYWIEIMGRLRSDVTMRQAEAVMSPRFRVFVAGTARTKEERAHLPGLWLQEGGSGVDALRRQFSQPLYVLLAMTGLILAIACSNVANLLLSRATVRRREIAIRLSLGAGRRRVIRQLLTESVLMAVAGGLLGLSVAAAGIRSLTWLLGDEQRNYLVHATIDARMLLFALSLSLLTGIIFGLTPALQATKVDVAPALKESRVQELRVRRFGLPFGLSQMLVAGQVALSVLLVVAAGLFVRTLIKLHSVSVGFNTEKLLLFNVDASRGGYDAHGAALFYEALRQRLATLPGVSGATMSDIPLVASSADSDGISVPGIPASPDKPLGTSDVLVGPHFFQTMGIPILLGRPIDEGDSVDAPHVAVVNEVFARRFFSGRNVIGQRFTFRDDKAPQQFQIVGVARNSLYSSLKKEIPPVAYVPWSQLLPGWIPGAMYYEIRTLGNPLALANTVRKVVHQADPRLPISELSTQVHYIEGTIAPERMFADLCVCFGLLALLIACVGLYGTLAYSVARRTNEIGIRIALGAQRSQVIWMVLREVLVLSLIGVVAGLCIAWESAHFLATFLFGIRPDDAPAFGAAAMLLISCAIAAGFSPAWRASRIDPVEALRNE